MRIILLALLVVGLAGCSAQPEPEPVVVTQTVTAAPPEPQDYLRVDLIQNAPRDRYTLQMQPFRLDSKGEPSYSGYSIRSVAVTTAAKQYPGEDDWPDCDEHMEGIRIKLFAAGSGSTQTDSPLQDLIWNGIHCTGRTMSYAVTINAGPELRFGAY